VPLAGPAARANHYPLQRRAKAFDGLDRKRTTFLTGALCRENVQRCGRDLGIGVADDRPRDEIVGRHASTVLQTNAVLALAGIVVVEVGRHHLGDGPRPGAVVDVEEVAFLDAVDYVDHLLGNDVHITGVGIDSLRNRVTL